MIPVAEASKRIFEEISPLPTERVSLLEALGRVLAEDIQAVRDLPPRDNSGMDGYAFRHADMVKGTREFEVCEAIRAGSEASRPMRAGEAAKIMTGAPVPEGADTVVPVEDTRILHSGRMEVLNPPERGAYVRAAGEDVRAGQVVLPAGTRVRPAEVGMLASLGRSFVPVYQRPRVAILATGDEIVELDAPTDGGKIINSNSYGVAAQVMDAGGVPVILGIGRDDPKQLTEALNRGRTADVLVTIGGVSMGDYDYVRPVLQEAGVDVRFWKVAMKPGKPFVFGVWGRVPVFGLPGNPVSAMVVFEQFVRPALLRLQGGERLFRPRIRALLTEEAGTLHTQPARMDFVRCRVEWRDGEFAVVQLRNQGSGLMHTLLDANALLIVPVGGTGAKPGDQVWVQLYDARFLDKTDYIVPEDL